LADVAAIREAAEASAGGGIVGVITGRAIYEGSLDLALAQQLCDEEINQPD
jgi:phosphoribosylformimino-5-aminoimidazole carboxamide ribotide isomerase